MSKTAEPTEAQLYFIAEAEKRGHVAGAVARGMVAGKDQEQIWRELIRDAVCAPTITYSDVLDAIANLSELLEPINEKFRERSQPVAETEPANPEVPDPGESNRLLKKIREKLDELGEHDGLLDRASIAEDLANAIQQLDESLTAGGLYPDAWADGRRGLCVVCGKGGALLKTDGECRVCWTIRQPPDALT